MLKKIIIHSDGGCEGNPGPGGWAAVLRYGEHVREVSGAVPATTNNRMELQAAIEALRLLKQACTIEFFTDSAYVKNGISAWLRSWKARGWRTATKQPVKNEDLWRALDEAAGTHQITWKWLKGHAGHPDNERCDQLASAAIRQLKQQFTRQQLAVHLQVFERDREAAETVQ